MYYDSFLWLITGKPRPVGGELHNSSQKAQNIPLFKKYQLSSFTFLIS
jgi:hypothetical protein